MEQSTTRTQQLVEEYLRLEEQAEVRHEFINNDVVAMAGGTVNHNLLIDNVKDLLKAGLRGCRIFSENMQVETVRNAHYTYPDIVVACHRFDLGGDNQIVRQPRLLVEVLSKSTVLADRGFKRQRYRKMPSLWYYVLVDQYTTTVELFSRIEETDAWVNTLYETPDDIIVLPRLAAQLPLSALYDGIELVPENESEV